MQKSNDNVILNSIVIAIASIALIGFAMWAIPAWGIYQQSSKGKAELAQAESNRKIAILEAQAKMESAEMLANAEVARAVGVARANEIIGVSLRENESYLTWLWIEALRENTQSVIYVPTEANLPILEANRFSRPLSTP